jgi:hypothetical protein
MRLIMLIALAAFTAAGEVHADTSADTCQVLTKERTAIEARLSAGRGRSARGFLANLAGSALSAAPRVVGFDNPVLDAAAGTAVHQAQGAAVQAVSGSPEAGISDPVADKVRLAALKADIKKNACPR